MDNTRALYREFVLNLVRDVEQTQGLEKIRWREFPPTWHRYPLKRNLMAPRLDIREAQLADMPAVMQLIGQADMSPDNELSDEQVEELYHQIDGTPFHRLYVAELDAEIVGTFALIVVQQLSHNAARSVVIEDIVVRSDLQGRGLGEELMEFAFQESQVLGCLKLTLSSGNARAKAHEFYEKLGYKRDGIRFALSG